MDYIYFFHDVTVHCNDLNSSHKIVHHLPYSSHGGSYNAYTSLEHMVYYFDILSPHLGGALDRFARFFIDPLIRADAVGREVWAVDSEYV